MKSWIIRYLPLLLLLVLFWWKIGSLIIESVTANGGHLIYALDDPYIHMSIAKNLVHHGIWGVTPEGFSSSASSLLWPLLNAGVLLLTGQLEAAPLGLNLFSATLAIIGMYVLGLRQGLPGWLVALLSAVVILVAPLPAMVLTGMEHVLHFLLSLFLVALAAEIFVSKSISRRTLIFLTIGLLLLTSIRYEGLFLAFVIVCLLVIRRFYRPALLGAFASALPVVAYGIWSTAQGWFFFPNPMLLKANILQADSLGGWFSRLAEFVMQRLDQNPDIRWLLLFSVLFLLVYRISRSEHYASLAWMFLVYLGMLIPHLFLANFGWFYRYEMYLVGLGILLELMVLAVMVLDGWNSHQILPVVIRIAITGVVLWLAFPLFLQRVKTLDNVVQATRNIYQQQYQMARFLDAYYPHVPVAVNDIGSVAYYSQVRLVDLWGLADRQIAQDWLDKRYTTSRIDALTRQYDVQIAIVYDAWFQNAKHLPDSWKRVGQWTIRDNVVCGDETVSFYAVDPLARDKLELNLQQFKDQLPVDVIQAGAYLYSQPASP